MAEYLVLGVVCEHEATRAVLAVVVLPRPAADCVLGLPHGFAVIVVAHVRQDAMRVGGGMWRRDEGVPVYSEYKIHMVNVSR